MDNTLENDLNSKKVFTSKEILEVSFFEKP